MDRSTFDVAEKDVRVPHRVARRKQTALDVGTALVLTILAWPFPLARANLVPIVHVVSILALWQVVQAGYFAVCAAFWRKTGGMHLFGMVLGTLAGAPLSRGSAVSWGLLAGILGIPRLISGGPAAGAPDLAEKLSGARVIVAD